MKYRKGSSRCLIKYQLDLYSNPCMRCEMGKLHSVRYMPLDVHSDRIILRI